MTATGLYPAERTVHLTSADGSILDWLTSPVWSTPCDDLAVDVATSGDPFAPDGRWVLTNGPDVGPLKEKLYARHGLDVDRDLPAPVEGGPLAWFAGGLARADRWRRVRTGEDGLVDWSEFCFTPEYRESVAAAVVEVDQSEWRTIEVRTTGPFVLWWNGSVILTGDRVSYMEPEVHPVRVRVPAGPSTLHVATWQVAFRECRHVVGVRIIGLPVRVVVPSPGADETVSRLADTVLAAVGSTSWAQDTDTLTLTAPPGVGLRVRTAAGGPWQRATSDGAGLVRVPFAAASTSTRTCTGNDSAGPKDHVEPNGASMLATGEAIVEVGLDDPRAPNTVTLRIAHIPGDSVVVPTGTPDRWRADVLAHVAASAAAGDGSTVAGDGSTAAVIAQHALDPDTKVGFRDIHPALHRITTRGDCADFEILGLLGAWAQIPADQWERGTREAVTAALTGMKFWITEPGLDAMCYFTENHQFVWHVAEMLVGELFGTAVFSNDGRTGAEHAAHGRGRAAAWMSRKLAGGFSEFDSNAYLAIDSFALVTLVELAADPRLAEAARTLLDKSLLTLATNSWRGIHGAAHGRSYVHTVRSSRFEETAPILRLICGVGSLNHAVLPVTALATARRYGIPDVVRELAGSEPHEWWGRQVYRGELAFERDLLARPYRSDLRVWRTPGAMLSSVQDYRAGLPGLQEHVWGATLGRELQVFVTHPANSDTGSSARPNGWVGHRVLPRVHQHKDVVVHLQRFTATDPLGYTHLWLPVAQVIEWARQGDWIAARTDEGFVAVATPGGVYPVLAGETAEQEWIPHGHGSVWVATVADGSAHADLAAWLGHLAGLTLTWDPRGPWDPGVTLARPGGPDLAVTFGTAFLVDGKPAGVDANGAPEVEPHLSNPAIELGFDDRAGVAQWNGARLELAIGRARDLLSEVSGDGR